MTDKTKQEIKQVLNECYVQFKNDGVLAKICALVDKEREGERIMFTGVMAPHVWMVLAANSEELDKRKGRLIFVPEGEK